jgi:hypothetical protein
MATFLFAAEIVCVAVVILGLAAALIVLASFTDVGDE